jgi:hypothetical protein
VRLEGLGQLKKSSSAGVLYIKGTDVSTMQDFEVLSDIFKIMRLYIYSGTHI